MKVHKHMNTSPSGSNVLFCIYGCLCTWDSHKLMQVHRATHKRNKSVRYYKIIVPRTLFFPNTNDYYDHLVEEGLSSTLENVSICSVLYMILSSLLPGDNFIIPAVCACCLANSYTIPRQKHTLIPVGLRLDSQCCYCLPIYPIDRII